jgi:hypothetical protein
MGIRVKQLDKQNSRRGATDMSIQKKSLISALKTTKKANVASSTDVKGENSSSMRGTHSVGAKGLGAKGLGAKGLGAKGLGAKGLGAKGLGAKGLGAKGLGAKGLGAKGLGMRGIVRN